MIIELNEVTQRVLETCEKLQTDAWESHHILRWFGQSDEDVDSSRILHHALDLEDETWTPMQKLRRVRFGARALERTRGPLLQLAS